MKRASYFFMVGGKPPQWTSACYLLLSFVAASTLDGPDDAPGTVPDAHDTDRLVRMMGFEHCHQCSLSTMLYACVEVWTRIPHQASGAMDNIAQAPRLVAPGLMTEI